ncbi:MAG: threonine synthase, partial [candidate division WOR-3 bacterium]
EDTVFSVPSGNFGDMCGGLLALRAGLPAERFVIATNENDEFPRFLAEEKYEKIEPSRVCISNAMNVGHPSNLPRVVALYGGMMDEKGNVTSAPDFGLMRKEMHSTSINDEQTRQAIVDTWEKFRVMLEPHGAVGWAALERYLADGHAPKRAIAIETAHPAKFPEEIHRLLKTEPEMPASLAGLDQKQEQYEDGPNEYKWFREWLRKAFQRPRGQVA